MKKPPVTVDIVNRAQAKYANALNAAVAYLGPQQQEPTASQKIIAGDPTASELLGRGYPQYVAENVARSRTEG